jgi:purine-nucleoside phosphorylase
MKQVVLPVKVARLLGCKLMLVTNAAGGLNPDFNVGDVMIIQDHFGFPIAAGNNPFVGHNEDFLGPRFFAVSDCYDVGLQEVVVREAATLGLERLVKPDGTYCYVSGPSYESRAESRFLRSIGGDSVGMSTIPEVLTARHCGMKILGLSMITNKVVMSNVKDRSKVEKHATHEEVLDAVKTGGKNVERIVEAVVSERNLRGFLDQVQTLELPAQDSTKPADAGKKEGFTNSFLFANFFMIIIALKMNHCLD